MKPKNKNCGTCKNFMGYYCKGIYNFYSEKYGKCSKQNKTVDINGNCSLWELASASRVTDEMLDRAISYAEELKKIF